MKRLHSDLSIPPELPPQEAHAVDVSLERWERALARRAKLKSVLHNEQELIREILNCGLCGGDRKTLRRLVTSSGNSDSDALPHEDLLAERIVVQVEKLQGILWKNHRALLELTAKMPEAQEEILHELDSVRVSLRAAQATMCGKLLHAKLGPDKELVRSLGRSLNDLRALLRRLDADRHEVTRNSRLAALLITVCRRVLPVREIRPTDLHVIPASPSGYLKIMDFYFFSDAAKYCFGENYSGPNWFTRLKRNVAILAIYDSSSNPVYNQFAVSGQRNKPGAPLARDDGCFRAIEAEDEHGRMFDRRNDAEFKLLSGFADSCTSKEFVGRGALWSKKPLCRSCQSVVRQFQERFPKVVLEVRVDSAPESGRAFSHCSASSSSEASTTPGQSEPGVRSASEEPSVDDPGCGSKDDPGPEDRVGQDSEASTSPGTDEPSGSGSDEPSPSGEGLADHGAEEST